MPNIKGGKWSRALTIRERSETAEYFTVSSLRKQKRKLEEHCDIMARRVDQVLVRIRCHEVAEMDLHGLRRKLDQS